ncbi:MAG: 6-bladed beta-propeller [candidate division Zixibacteria bacterium]
MDNSKKNKLWFWGGVILLLLSFSAAFAQSPKLVGAFFVNGRVGLKWQDIEGTSEYFVYRQEGAGDFEKIDSSEKARYFDIDIEPGVTYKYKISIIGPDGKEVFSGVKSVSIPAAQEGEFDPPTWSGLRIDRNSKIMLNWDKVPGAIAYNIYRSSTPGEAYEVVGNSQTSRYADKEGLIHGETYYYVVTALNSDFEETEYSEERNIKFGMSNEEVEAAKATMEKIELEPVNISLLFEIKDAEFGVTLLQPSDVYVNSKGDIYVVDVLNFKIRVYDSKGKYRFSFGERSPSQEDPDPATFSYPFTLFIDKQDQVYVTDILNNNIQVFEENGKFIKEIRVVAGEGKKELRANGIYVLDDDRIIITDAGNHRILILDQNGKILKEIGGPGGAPGTFTFPAELVVTENNIICVVDIINCRVQEFDLEGNFIRMFGEPGQSAGTFGRPDGIAIDEKGMLWVTDILSGMVQRFTVEGKIKSAIGTINDDFEFATPRGIFFKGGRLYITERLRDKVNVYEIKY